MKAIIHCAGMGTRLPKVTKHIPKPMAEINRKPLLFWTIENLKRSGIKEVYITLHHLSEEIRNYLKDGREFGISVKYSYEKNLLGTGGALCPLTQFLTENTLVLYGDVITKVDFRKMLKFHQINDAVITCAVHPASHPKDSDLVQFNKENNSLIRLLKKPNNNFPQNPYNLAALYLLNPMIVPFLSLTPPFDMEHDLIPHVLNNHGRIFCYNTDEFMMDIGTPQRLKEAKKLLSL